MTRAAAHVRNERQESTKKISMRIPGLSEETIEQNTEEDSIIRGKSYVEAGAVKSLKRTSGTEVEAYVQGSDIAPYHVTIRHDDEGITSAKCTCPYVGGTWCRHIVAALMTSMESKGVLSRPLDEMLLDLDREDLIRLIESLLDLYPEIAGVIEEEHERRRGR